MRYLSSRCLAAAAVLACCIGPSPAQSVSGVKPELSVLLISDEDGLAQMALQNSDPEPYLVQTVVYTVDGDKDLVVKPTPVVSRIEAGGRQIVRFALTKPAKPLVVQHYQRVTFEGIPATAPKDGRSRVRVNVRYDYPIIISPANLPPLDAPWTLLEWRMNAGQLEIYNSSRYVVRMSEEVDLLPAQVRVKLLQRSFVLPGERLSVALPAAATVGLTTVRVYPATLFGFAAPTYDAKLNP